MDSQPKWQAPPTEINAFSFVLFAQFGAVMAIASWFLPSQLSEFDAPTVVLLVGLLGIGFLQLFRVQRGRLLTYPIIALLALSWVLLGEFEIGDAAFVVVFMSIVFSFLLYLPALGFEEFGMSISRPRRKMLLLLLLIVFTTMWFGLDALEYGTSNEVEIWDESLEEDVFVTASPVEFAAAAGAAVLYVVGVIGLILIGGLGVKLGPIRPAHAAFALALGNGLMGLYWVLVENEISIEGILDLTAIGGLMFLPVVGFFGEHEQEGLEDTAHDQATDGMALSA
ncbi:MAG: hypothetical protein ACPH76_07230 [Poseidonia sp.]